MAAAGDTLDGLVLIRAVRGGEVEQAAVHLAAGVPLDVVDSDDRTALMWAASMGSEELVAMLLKAGTDPNQANSHRRTALMYVANQDRHELLPILVDAGADVNATDSSGRNVLDFALHSANNRSARILDRNKSARLLLKAGARPGKGVSRLERLRQRVQQAVATDEFEEWALRLPVSKLAFVYPCFLGMAAAFAPDHGMLGAVLSSGLLAFVLSDLLLVFPSGLQGLARLAGHGRDQLQVRGPVSTPVVPEQGRSITDVGFVSRLISDRSRELRRAPDDETKNPLAAQKSDAFRQGSSAIIWLAIATAYASITVAGLRYFDSVFLQTALAAIVIWLVLKLERRLRWNRLKRSQARIDAAAARIGTMLEDNDISIAGPERSFGVYLRPFVTTNRIPLGRMDLETLLAYSFAPVLPFVALGRPGEHVGAGRIQTTDEHWQDKIAAMLERSALILCIPSARPGTMWELGQLRTRGLLAKTVFIMPRDFELPPDSRPFGMSFSDEWRETVMAAARADLQLPDFSPKGLLFQLAPDGRFQAQAPLEVEPLITLQGGPGSGTDWGEAEASDDAGADGDAGPQDAGAAGGSGPDGGDRGGGG